MSKIYAEPLTGSNRVFYLDPLLKKAGFTAEQRKVLRLLCSDAITYETYVSVNQWLESREQFSKAVEVGGEENE